MVQIIISHRRARREITRHILSVYKEFKTSCHTVCKLNKFSHVTPFLHKLHWLPIHYRILFKYNLLTYKAIHFSQPLYLSSLIRRSDLTRVSSSKTIKRSGLHSSYSHRVEQASWISGFRKQLKTYLFRLAYPPP